MSNLKKLKGLVCIIYEKNGKILLLKRTKDKKYYPNKWAVVSAGPLSNSENMKTKCFEEIEEETHIPVTNIRRFEEHDYIDSNIRWTIVPFTALAEHMKVILNKEHTKFKWIEEGDLSISDMPPYLANLISKVISKTKIEGHDNHN